MTRTTLTILVLLTVACAPLPVRADVWSDLASYELGAASRAPDALEKLVAETPVGARAPIEAKLIELISTKSASAVGKRYACRMLQRIGTPKSIPALGALLGDKILSHYARLALQRMGDVPAAVTAMREALPGAPDSVKAGLVGSLGEVRDAQSVAEIAKLTGAKDPRLASTALRALGKIGDKAALAELQKASVAKGLENVRVEATIDCAARLGRAGQAELACDTLAKIYQGDHSPFERVAALAELLACDEARASAIILGLIKGPESPLRLGALRLVATTKGGRLTTSLVDALDGFNAGTRAHVIALLGKRGDKAALAGVLGCLKSKDDGVRGAAIEAVGELGGAEQVPALLAQAKAGGVGATAIAALARTGAPGIDKALATLLSDKDLKSQAIAALAARGSRSGARAVIRLASDPDADVRAAAWANMPELAGETDVPALMKVLVGIKDAKERDAAIKAVRFISSEARDRDKCFEAIVAYYDKTDESTRTAILGMGSYIGTRKALDLERSALKSGSAAEKAAALRALAAWSTPEAAEDLLKLAKDAGSDTDKIIALRGLIQVAGKGGPVKQQFALLNQAAELAKRPEEKRLLIGTVRGNRRIESILLAAKFLNDADVAPEAQQAVLDLAGRVRDRKNPGKIVAVLKTIIETTKDKRIAKRAQDTIKKIEPK